MRDAILVWNVTDIVPFCSVRYIESCSLQYVNIFYVKFLGKTYSANEIVHKSQLVTSLLCSSDMCMFVYKTSIPICYVQLMYLLRCSYIA